MREGKVREGKGEGGGKRWCMREEGRGRWHFMEGKALNSFFFFKVC